MAVSGAHKLVAGINIHVAAVATLVSNTTMLAVATIMHILGRHMPVAAKNCNAPQKLD